jgi:hypothetical protein
MQEWIVTLHNREDLPGFYDDMETEGGNLFIPNRAVEVAHKRPISRNTHYMLTREEVDLIKSDDRVWDVTFAEFAEMVKPNGWVMDNEKFSKDWNTDESDHNWGLLRHSEATNRNNWGSNATTNITSDLTSTASGKNVDVVIVDGHIDPVHPEFAVNADGTGGTRINQFNWFSLTNAVTGGSNGTYMYSRSGSYLNSADVADNNHGCHCAGTVAGNSQGWARDANIYNISPYGSNPNSLPSSLLWDYVREWHNTKAINPATGRRNPTITNNSYGSIVEAGDGNWGKVTRITYRGVNFNPGRDLTQAELQARGCYAPLASGQMTLPLYDTSRQADHDDAIADGIIIVASAGNDSWKITEQGDQDYNNDFDITFGGNPYTLKLHRGSLSGAYYAPIINVGAQSNDLNEDKANFSNCGSQIDIYAAGEGIQSSLHSGGTPDTRNSAYELGKYQGTSMAGPQVAGVLAILAESRPNMTQAEAHAWIINNANVDQMADTDADDPMDRNSLQGSANRMLRWINQRAISGNSFPQKNFSDRPTTGTLYPRARIRRRG